MASQGNSWIGKPKLEELPSDWNGLVTKHNHWLTKQSSLNWRQNSTALQYGISRSSKVVYLFSNSNFTWNRLFKFMYIFSNWGIYILEVDFKYTFCTWHYFFTSDSTIRKHWYYFTLSSFLYKLTHFWASLINR